MCCLDKWSFKAFMIYTVAWDHGTRLLALLLLHFLLPYWMPCPTFLDSNNTCIYTCAGITYSLSPNFLS